MAGLVPAIHVLSRSNESKDVDARHKAGHDEFPAEYLNLSRPHAVEEARHLGLKRLQLAA